MGNIVISAEQAQKQAAENGLTLEGEIKQLMLHGLLHLCGYDHETDKGEMNARELELRKLSESEFHHKDTKDTTISKTFSILCDLGAFVVKS